MLDWLVVFLSRDVFWIVDWEGEMNICAVRMVRESLFGIYEPLPHQPKSEQRFALKEISQPDRQPLIGDYAECKHCNCIFAVDVKPEK